MNSSAGLLEMKLMEFKQNKISLSKILKIFQNMKIKKEDLLLVLKALKSGNLTISEAKEEIQDKEKKYAIK